MAHVESLTTNKQMENIVIFGETGAGKSSVINLMVGQQVAKVSPDSRRCTLHWEEHVVTLDNGTRYRMFDTVGLEDSHLESKDYLSAITNAYDLVRTLKERGGINLLLFCIRGGRITATTKNNYKLFFEFLCEEKVPLALVITNLEREKVMEDWYTRNVDHLEKRDIHSVGHACITAATTIDGRYREKYEESRRIICGVIQAHCNALTDGQGWSGGQGWFPSLVNKLMDFVIRQPRQTDITEVLMKRCGMAKGVAQQITMQLIRSESQPQSPKTGQTSLLHF